MYVCIYVFMYAMHVGMHAAAVVSLLCLSVIGQSCRAAANCRQRGGQEGRPLEMAVDAPGGKHAVSHPSDVARLQELAKYAVDQINRRAVGARSRGLGSRDQVFKGFKFRV
jgi:hypothetical protein